MACGARQLRVTSLVVISLLACKREDPQIRALTEQAAQADEAAQQLRQAWSAQFRRLTRAGLKPPPVSTSPMRLTDEQKRALEARVHIEKDSSRRALLQEILDKELELQALGDRLRGLLATLPAPEIARPNDSHYGLALRFLRNQGQSDAQARKTLSRVIISDQLLPGFEVYHFYVHGQYGTWVAQGKAPISPRELASQDLDQRVNERDEAVATGRRLQRELGRLESQKQLIEQEIADIQAERTHFLEGRTQLQSEHAHQAARLNSLHYLVGIRDTLEAEGIIEVPLFGKDHSGRHWGDALFTQHLDLRTAHTLVIRAQDQGLKQIGKVSLVPGSYLLDEHYRLSLSTDRQTATVELLALPRFKNDKVVFAISE